MCGICGTVDFSGRPVVPDVLRRMTDSLAHRGPDGRGVFMDGPVGLGHRRLAIIDLSPAGRQPMTTPDGRFTIVYNGEVYNFRELRAELEDFGVSFRSRSDTEVVLHALAVWGPQAVERFNGMFALALWDNREGHLLLARDRYGVKPLYWCMAGGALVFGSEQKALLAHPALRREIDLECILEYFTFQNVFTDRTLLDGVRLFPPGSLAVVDVRRPGAALQPVRYWDYDFREPESSVDEREYAEELERLFRQAVVRQLVSDVDVGAYLSGGMDSGAITAVAARELPFMRTFTCGFDLHSASGLEYGYDERELSELMSYRFRTEHYEMVLKAGDMERVMPRLAQAVEEPRVGQSYPNFYVAQLAGKFVKVVLSGTGGDELFGGYPWRYYRAVVNSSFEDYVDKYYLFWQRLIPNTQLRRVFAPVWAEVSHVWTRDIFRDVFGDRLGDLSSPEDYVNGSLYFEARTFLHGLLVVEDKLSMAHGLETRVPFLDNDLVDFAMRLPVSLKLGNLGEVSRINENEPGKLRRYFERTRDGKLLLRRMMAGLVPPEVAGGVKRGFSAPDASWFKGESIDYVRSMLLGDEARIFDYLDRKAVRDLVGEHLDGRTNRRLFIWSLLSFEWWLRTFLP
ncbi:asparagine synthase (glutamine-hydrolysing) [Desulfobaculum xiamenense]|uniref:asparagine synthase (glutamine-hydrolyzing) n=1 Tax=Desulfobaculum xiamenense TaxID=995050 RepID=A0A846QQQ3_9BACT|nr:asparagine synthase (glutamine-hydrolyzing) [Desulfobaculum xiamenense]NJB69507.1 asparagine synthase (glutamine-hydrolysing) [Desulfobaculum xiamenense]